MAIKLPVKQVALDKLFGGGKSKVTLWYTQSLPPHTPTFTQEYVEWRRKLKEGPTAHKFETAGTEVTVTSALGMITIILSLALIHNC